MEPTLTPAQYAYRRARGTELQLAEIYDFAQAGNHDDLRVYLASLDTSRAFDTVSHHTLMRTAGGLDTDPYLTRFVERRLRGRQFSVRLASSAGPLLGTFKPGTRGLPQGGVLSPFPWLLHFMGLHAAVQREVSGSSGEMSEVRV